jgi:hypothetical protein
VAAAPGLPVILAGFRGDVERFLPHADLMVNSSFTEGLPVVWEVSGHKPHFKNGERGVSAP